MKIFLLSLFLLGGLLAGANAVAPALIVILLPGTSLNDWQRADAPNLHKLIRTGSLGVMNTRTAHHAGQTGQEPPQAALLTLGAGARAAAGASPEDFSLAAVKVPGTDLSTAALFERRTGLKPQSDQSVCLDWPSILVANRSPGYDLSLGNLAGTLEEHGIKIAAGGGHDSDWIAATSNGTVTHVTKLKADPQLCLIWDAGTNLVAADTMIASAVTQIANGPGRLIILSPYASNANYREDERLTPILLWGKGVPAGLLASPSTRRLGLVTNTDFAPSVAEYFSIRRTEFKSLPFGFAWHGVAASNNSVSVELLTAQSIQQAHGMKLLPYLAVMIGVWLLGATLAVDRYKLNSFWTLSPLVSLIAALFATSGLEFWIVLPCLLLLAVILVRFQDQEHILAFLAGGTALTLMVDMVTGNHRMRQGLLGYSAIEGARYYGIGNEAMGLLIGAALIAVSAWRSPNRNRQSLLLGLLGVIVLMLGSAGAKAGGVLVSLAVFVTFAYTASGRRWTVRAGLWLCAVILGGMVTAALTDAFLLPGGHSHIGEAVQRVLSGGIAEASDIVRRKLAVEGRLAYHSAWAVLLWTGLACTIFLWKRMPTSIPASVALRFAGVAGVVACLLLNDAGVVAAAIFLVTLWSEAIVQKQKLPTVDLTKVGSKLP